MGAGSLLRLSNGRGEKVAPECRRTPDRLLREWGAAIVNDVDAFDRKLLELLQADSRQTGEQLSGKVGLSAAACLRRVQRLRKIGAIEREVAVISPRFGEPEVTMIVLLTIDRDRPERADLFRKKMLDRAEVKHLYHVTGAADFILIVGTRSVEDYARFTEVHFYEPGIKRFESIVVLRDARK